MNEERKQQIASKLKSELRQKGLLYVLREYSFYGVKLIDWCYSLAVIVLFEEIFPSLQKSAHAMPIFTVFFILTAFLITKIRKRHKKEPFTTIEEQKNEQPFYKENEIFCTHSIYEANK